MAQVLEGMEVWENAQNGFTVARVHYTADPRKRTEAWKALERAGIPQNEWDREYEINFSSFTGKPVFENDYDDNRMCLPLAADPKFPILRGWDFGFHHPAVVWAQLYEGIQFRVLESDMGTDVDFRQYVRRIQNLSSQYFPGRRFLDCCDQAGNHVRATDDQEVRILVGEFGIIPRYKYFRVDYTLQILRQYMAATYRKNPAFLINKSPSNELLREALRGGYHYAKPHENKAFKEEPFQDGYYENIIDPLRYIAANFTGTEGGHMKTMQQMSDIDTYNERTGWQ